MTLANLRRVTTLLCACGAFLSQGLAQEAPAPQPPLSLYGSVPEVRSVALSDSGNKVAQLREDANGEYVLVRDYATGDQTGFRIDGFKPISVSFVGDRYVILRASATESLFNVLREFEFSFSYIFDTEEETVEQLLASVNGIVPGSDSGRVIGVLEDSGELLIPARTYPQLNSSMNAVSAGLGEFGSSIFRVKPDTGRVRVFEGDRLSGRLGTGDGPKYRYAIDWVVSDDGTIIAREDYNQRTNTYRIFTRASGRWEELYESDPENSLFVGGRPYTVVGTNLAEDAVLMTGFNAVIDERVLYELPVSGGTPKIVAEREGRDVKRVLSDDNRRVFAVEFAGLEADYQFFDAEIDAAFSALKEKMVGFNLEIQDWSADLGRFLVKVSGGGETGSYYLFQVETGGLSMIAKGYDVAPAWIGQMQTLEYPASDGTLIPAIITWPAGTAETNIPLVVLPHGGPAGHDSVSFNWMAQYFASRGYMVFQPNFRGSDGFGSHFEISGYGEWGLKMQTDIHDGIRGLISAGWVDPDRICIVGASYGGYAALAGGMTEPDMFQCVAAIAPVTDLPDILRYYQLNTERSSFTFEYWTASIGDIDADAARLVATSPARNADKFNAPVLLVHGRDDTIVPLNQSRQMRSALRNAGKSVELVELPGGDHWMSTTEARRDTLQAVAAFVEEHIGPAQ